VKLVLIAAVARNRAIGRGNQLLWREPADQRHFRDTTMGHAVIMGRKTWESIAERFRPLPGRRNIVVTRSAGYAAPGAEVAGSLDAALERVQHDPRVFVIGGAQLYAQALPRANELILTEIDADFDGDAHFPRLPPGEFAEVGRETRRADDGTRFDFVTYRRR
jgi:dihydrofolate reductase